MLAGVESVTLWRLIKACLMGALVKIFALALLSGAALAEIENSDLRIDQNLLASQSERFRFGSDGFLLEGPIRGYTDPIDYSPLIKSGVMKVAFEGAIMNCYEGVWYCYDDVFKWKKRQLNLKVLFEKGSIKDDDFHTLRDGLKNTVGVLGFDVVAVKDENSADLVLNIGSISHLSAKLNLEQDEYGLNEVEFYRSNSSTHTVFRMLGAREAPFCYVSTKDWKAESQISIFLNSRGLEKCLYRSLLHSIGLHPTPLGIPTVTDISSDYQNATFADVLFARMLYHDDFPSEKSRDAVRSFWNQHAAYMHERLLSEDISLD